MLTTILTIGGFVLQLLTLPFRMLARMCGFNDDPEISFEAPSVDVTDSRMPYRTWYHVRCTNRQLEGMKGKIVRTQDARDCHVAISFTNKANGSAITKEGVFVVGATPPERSTTLFVDRPVLIPVYWVAESNDAPDPLNGQMRMQGTYITGQEFIWWPQLWQQQQLPPGTYQGVVRVGWNRKVFEYAFDLEVTTACTDLKQAQTDLELYYDPDPTSDFIHIMVRNNGPTDQFVGEVLDMEGAEIPQKLPWEIKWRGQKHKPDRQIISGHKWPLDLCEAFAPRAAHDDEVIGSKYRGWFRFYSTSEPTGWRINAGPRELIVPYDKVAEAMAEHDSYDEELTLKIVASGISSGTSITKRIKLGFNRPLKKTYKGDRLVVERVKERFRVEIDDWPTE
jgi:hypothetical protein